MFKPGDLVRDKSGEEYVVSSVQESEYGSTEVFTQGSDYEYCLSDEAELELEVVEPHYVNKAGSLLHQLAADKDAVSAEYSDKDLASLKSVIDQLSAVVGSIYDLRKAQK